MPTLKLTNTTIEKLACPAGQRYAFFWDTVTKGLGVRVNADGSTRTYILLYRVRGSRQERQITIGRHNDPYRIDQARDRALVLKTQMREGVDPVLQAQQKADAEKIDAVKSRAESITLEEVMRDYLANHRTVHSAPLRPATKRDIERHVTVNLADWCGEPVASITQQACIERFNAIAESSESQAEQCLAYLRSLLNHARDMFEDLKTGAYPILAVNPAQRAIKKVKPAKQKAREVRIPTDRIRAVWQMVQARRAGAFQERDRIAADWISFILLTGCRKTESGSLLWANVDLEARTFHMASDIVKNHSGITLPMSTVMHKLLSDRLERAKADAKKHRHAVSPFVFPSTGESGYIQQAQAVMAAVSKLAGEHIQIHDLRRTMVDVCAAVGVSADKERLLLNHKSGDVHARHYANSSKTLTDEVEKIAQWITAAEQL